MNLPVPTTLAPMEARLRTELPTGDGWIYEPKWDGFRCLAFRDGGEVVLRSKAGKPLERYFPDVVATLLDLPATPFAIDGEIVIPVEGALSFDELLLRIHPAASRVEKLAAANPAVFIAFDILVDPDAGDVTGAPLSERRALLNAFASRVLREDGRVQLSPATEDGEIAREWLDDGRIGLDGVVAKRADLPYQAGNRNGMVKVKRLRTADCVVGGFRRAKSGRQVASLLLGLYNAEGKLDHVGFCSALDAERRAEANRLIPPLRGGEGFTGRAPAGSSRWRREGSGDWEPVRPEIVVEVQYDHFTSGRFRHGTTFLRWRPDKPPESCRLDQVEEEARNALPLLQRRRRS